MEHLHVSVIENNRYTDRRACLHGMQDQLSEAKSHLTMLIEQDQNSWAMGLMSEGGADHIEALFMNMLVDIETYDGTTEAWEGEITLDGITYGYRIMDIDGDCDQTI